MGKSCSKFDFLLRTRSGHFQVFSTSAGDTVSAAPESFITLCAQGHLKRAFTAHFSLIYSDPTLLSHPLKACIDRRSSSTAKQLHSITITGGWSRLRVVSNHLMNAYSKLGQLETARKMFDRMPERNVMSYNILIGGCIQNGKLGAAVEIFHGMGERNSATWNAVIAGLIKFESNEEGLRMFSEMHKDGISPDAYTLGSVLRGCAGLRDLIKGKQVHCYGVKLGLEFDLVVGSSMSHMYMKCGSLSEGKSVIESMPIHNVVSFNTLIAGLVQNGCASGALDQYYLMKGAGFRPDKITFVSAITSCSQLPTLGQGQQIHTDAVKAGAMLVASVLSSLISMYSRCGCLDDAVRVFEEREGVLVDTVLWSSMITAYGFHGKAKEAIELFNQIEAQGLEVNDVAFLAILYSCSHSGLKDEGFEFLDLMVNKYKLIPQTKHYNCIVDLLGRVGDLDEAERFIRSMPIAPDTIIWKALLSACKTHKNPDMAKRIAGEILKIDPQDSASYVLLANAQASAQRWQDVFDVRREMKERMVKKVPGVSWFELKNQVHLFVMGDGSHPQSEKIDSYLKELTVELKLFGYVPEMGGVLHDMDMEEKEHNLVHHTEKLAVGFALMNTPEGVPIRIMKNLRVCEDCHAMMKCISEVKNREIVLRDSSRFHHFKSGICSCGDYW
ncbi:pentatricopeptide repeat-containing protein At2g41080 isoform X1 [Andrographis paniculata]|uniref:pentatricopeptide repeat-containing protein At2g41080 isoform X1 n=1 Tax=Andrographis paniculata TaxID=175694 RepID=UPI0021E8BCFC|nr:pentatricopeptide repeat-containing protein At2g41080 isoform X1 [Andrographis paniculata]XP_051116233.1 pentatricopeptide repeat-containing protein At2g41080 isoform X1 [Andrographis paniculata]XP_051116234.1 pentatricopeptide repeat-containing protein At2g41080 isoform X2 [Andrographis paniculata]XP_051116235.1 pentatricopeptide repeat-containing protein At2g41080 isoform X1 [Andrographis paniculata]XP_051116236.1 pentatricopeptide repeat-containing protein At2g41080 isoform X1 [Andrograph